MSRGETYFGLGVLVVWALWAIGSVAVTLGLVYAAFHFIAKFW